MSISKSEKMKKVIEKISLNDACLFDTKALMTYLSVSRPHIIRMRKDGILKAYKLRGKIVFKKEEVIKALENHLVPAGKD